MEPNDTKRAPAPVGVLRGHSAPVNAVCAVAATSVASGSADGVVKLWDLRSRRETSSADAHSKAGLLQVARLDGARMLTHGRDGHVKLWDINTFGAAAQPLQEWYCGSFTFTKAATMRWRDADGARDDHSDLVICPTANEKDILVYDPRMNESTPAMFVRLADPNKTRGMCMSLSLFTTSSSGGGASGNSDHGARQTYIAAGWEGGQLTLLDLRAGGKLACEAQVATGTNPLLAFDVSRDGRTILCGSSSEELSAVTVDYASLETKVTPFFSVNQGGISYVRMRGDQRIFATAGWDHRARVFHTRKLKPLAILKYHSESVFAVDFTPDDNFMLSASKDHKIALWSIYPPTPESAQRLTRPARA